MPQKRESQPTQQELGRPPSFPLASPLQQIRFVNEGGVFSKVAPSSLGTPVLLQMLSWAQLLLPFSWGGEGAPRSLPAPFPPPVLQLLPPLPWKGATHLTSEGGHPPSRWVWRVDPGHLERQRGEAS